jgi:glycine cleavage system aminomethyltransferase T
MVSADCARIGEAVEVAMPSRPVQAIIVERPFFDPRKKLAAA